MQKRYEQLTYQEILEVLTGRRNLIKILYFLHPWNLKLLMSEPGREMTEEYLQQKVRFMAKGMAQRYFEVDLKYKMEQAKREDLKHLLIHVAQWFLKRRLTCTNIHIIARDLSKRVYSFKDKETIIDRLVLLQDLVPEKYKIFNQHGAYYFVCWKKPSTGQAARILTRRIKLETDRINREWLSYRGRFKN